MLGFGQPNTFLSFTPKRSLARFAQRALDRRNEPKKAVLQDVIRDTRLHRFDGHLFAEDAGYEDEGDIRIMRPGNRQRFSGAEAGQLMVREDQIGFAVQQSLAEIGLERDTLRVEMRSRGAQFAHDQLCIGWIIFQQRNSHF